MYNPAQAADHLQRVQASLPTLDLLYEAENWAGVVRE